MSLNVLTVDELNHKLDIAETEYAEAREETGLSAELSDDAESWFKTLIDLRDSIRDDCLYPKAAAELMQMTDAYLDSDKTLWRAVQVDLARGGYLDKYDPNAVVMGRKVRTITVDGVKYETA